MKTEREKVAHLLRRFGLGASESELDFYAKDGLKGAIDKLIDYDKVDEGFDIPITDFQGKDQKLIVMQAVAAHWYLRLLCTRRPLQEKLTVFWHDHFATSGSKVNVPPLMYNQIETFRKNALGKFGDMLLEVSKDPAMLFWLDNQYNVKGKPNENFAREVMELFTLGVDNGYTEKDIQESARAFTGWLFRRQAPREGAEFVGATYVFAPRLHDEGEKTIFGQTGNFGGEDVIKMLCDKPQCGRYIAKKMWTWFAYENPEPSVIDRIASTFKDSGLDLKVLVRSIMEAPEFYSEKAERKIYKNPIDFVIPTMRELGVGEMAKEAFTTGGGSGGRARVLIGTAQQTCKSMGMELLFPPDVSGWEGGQAWVTSATMVERIRWADRLFGQAGTEGRRGQVVGYPAYGLFTDDPSPKGVVKKLLSLFDVDLPKEKVGQVEKAVSEYTPVTQRNANEMAAKASRLIFGSPEFQFS
jgi:uncharacterized protein (DUF1800 family)